MGASPRPTGRESPRVASLLRRAFLRCAAPEANARIDAVRRSFGAGAVSYEIVLPQGQGQGWRYLACTVAPRLARFLRCKHLRVGSCASVFLPIFAGDALYFVAAPEFFACYREVEGLSQAGFDTRARAWEQGESAPLAAKLLS